ncbi:MAG: hypothetical protein ABSA81_03675 [Candidatus Bathyarchaeia archaeon]|jgi:hypothetical protein
MRLVLGAEVLGVLVTCGELVVGALGVGVALVIGVALVVVGGAEGLKKLCKGVSGLAPGLVSEGRLHL